MSRAVLTFAVIAGLVVGRAARAEPDPCEPAPVDASLRSLAVELGPAADGDGWTRTLAPTASSQFPAVSEDGKTIVDLFADSQDFVGTPIATVVFWTRAGRAEAFQLESEFGGPGKPVSPARTRLEADVVAKANARLATTRWRALAVASPCPNDDANAPVVMKLGDGLQIEYDAAHARLTSEVTVRPRHPKRTRLRARFPSPGSRLGNADEGGGAACGGATGLQRGYGSRALGFVVLVPRVNLGGDSCFGMLSVDLAIVVRVP